jgi:AcrR family transcriptional regulator
MKVTNKLTVLDQITASHMVRRKIIDAASVLYAKKGFAATSIEEIAEKAGVTLPVTYRYVKKKSEIMQMIMEDVLHTFRKSLTSQIQGLENPAEKLDAAAALYFRVVDEERDKLLLLYQKSGSLDRVAKGKIMQLEVEIAKIFGEILKDGVQKGLFKSLDEDLMAYNIIMMAHTWVLKRWHFKNRLSLDQFVALQSNLLMETLRK